MLGFTNLVVAPFAGEINADTGDDFVRVLKTERREVKTVLKMKQKTVQFNVNERIKRINKSKLKRSFVLKMLT